MDDPSAVTTSVMGGGDSLERGICIASKCEVPISVMSAPVSGMSWSREEISPNNRVTVTDVAESSEVTPT